MKIRTNYESYHGHYRDNEIWIPGSIVTTTIELVYAEWKYNTTHAFNFTVPKFPHCDAVSILQAIYPTGNQVR